jgi:hypothetical protein
VKCPCDKKSDIELAICLAPPAGEYEVSHNIGSNKKLILNSDGIFIRSYSINDYLPFFQTTQLKIKDNDIKLFKISLNQLICKALEGLKEASEHGSTYAKEKIEKCKDIIDELTKSYCK